MDPSHNAFPTFVFLAASQNSCIWTQRPVGHLKWLKRTANVRPSGRK
jgi:hypothetical protein